jgi:polysaccharide pyruvyl transferase WcaK-like protein
VKVVLVGDLGGTSAFHVGDEAMALSTLRAGDRTGLDLTWTAVSGDPVRTREVLAVDSVPLLGFAACRDGAAREALLATLDALLDGPVGSWVPEAPEGWRATLSAVLGADAVVVAGGGNLSCSWPEHVYERVALARVARRAGIRVAVLGQTLGPVFGLRLLELVHELLAGSHLVGVRERTSLAIATDLGIDAVLDVDLAAELEPCTPADAVHQPFVAVSLDESLSPELLPGLRRQLAELAQRTALLVVLVPHVGDLAGAATHDVATARQLCFPTAVVAALPTPAEAVWWSQQAAMVISSRYHPVVFALAHATPALFLCSDGYTAMKGGGVLDLHGLGSWSLDVQAAASGALLTAALDLADQRAAVCAHLSASRQRSRLVETLLHVLGTGDRPRSLLLAPPGPPPRPGWPRAAPLSPTRVRELELAASVTHQEGVLDALREAADAVAGQQQRAEHAEEYARTLEVRAAVAEQYAASLERARDAAD